MDVAGEGKQVLIPFHRFGSVAPLKEMAMAPVPRVVEGGIGGIEAVHETPQIGLWGFEKGVEMRSHLAVGIETDMVRIDPLDQLIEKGFVVPPVAEEPLLGVAPLDSAARPLADNTGRDMVDRSLKLHSRSSCHAATYPHHTPQ